MTVEERAQQLWEETRWSTERKDRIDSYARALRDQVEACAKICDAAITPVPVRNSQTIAYRDYVELNNALAGQLAADMRAIAASPEKQQDDGLEQTPPMLVFRDTKPDDSAEANGKENNYDERRN